MNAIDPGFANPHATDGVPGQGPGRDLVFRALPPLRAVLLVLLALGLPLAVLWGISPWYAALAALRSSRLVPLAASSLVLALAGVAGTLAVAAARCRAAEPARPQRTRRWLPRRRACGDERAVGRAARWPQAAWVGGLGTAAALLAFLPLTPGLPVVPATHFILGATAVGLAFPLLVTERCFAAMSPARLPEAPALRRLLLVPVLAWPAAGLVQVAAGLGLAAAPVLDTALATLLALLAAELALRALARPFLPPPAPDAARAAVDTLLCRVLADGIGARSIAVPVRAHLGIDFSRSWALLFVRRAALPVMAVLALVCWGLSGLVLVSQDGRAVYERFGAPAAVLHPGLHAILPWPMGRARPLEYGTLHEVAPEGAIAVPGLASPAEAAAPPDADRLWDGAHPGEQTLLVASEAGGRQGFGVVGADIRLRYRIGMTDADAFHAAYAAADPEALLRAVAGQEIARFCAGQTPDALLGENREQLGDALRATVQRRLDADNTGLEVLAVVIEAIHPPAGAADAYHAVQAAEIVARASVSAERGRASATLSHAAQYAAELVAQAQAAGAEATARATADTASFVADRESAAAHPHSFLLERRLAAVGAGLAKSTLTVIDRRIPAGGMPVLDLRPLTPTTAATARDGE